MMSLLARSKRLLPSPSSSSTRLLPSISLRIWSLRHQVHTTSTNATPTIINNTNTNTSTNDTNNNNEPRAIHDVIIIGGGPTGLLLSNLLHSHNIHSQLLFDKRPISELLKHPQAHFINIRSMEILKAEVPNVYKGVLREMPDVREWEGFTFGGCVLESHHHRQQERREGQRQQHGHHSFGGGRRLGRVVHPVREPLKVGQCGDAILVSKMTGNANEENNVRTRCAAIDATNGTDSDRVVSACRPAHLAQNKFVSLLLQEARRHYSKDDDRDDEQDDASRDSNEDMDHRHHLRYGEEVIHISQQHVQQQSLNSKCNNNTADTVNATNNNPSSSPPITTIQTSHGNTYHTRYLLAADGVHSFTRNHHLKIPMMGESSMQSLVNVHFRTNDKLSELLMSRNGYDDAAMLHFTYNSQLVGAFVCHDGKKGEWVLQIPFFPPFQTMEEDFDARKVREMIWAGLVGSGSVHPHGDGGESKSDRDFDFDVLSIRPWTMSSLVAQRYVNESRNVALVGDAAHSFPPAGGFGMNTGLQDAHNIAWRLALLLLDGGRGNSSEASFFSEDVLSKYDAERRPIATQNAALSVRNYRRTLRIAKACYLDAQHPQLLLSMLGMPPANLLPMETRRDMFRRLVGVAMMPLGSLVSSSSIEHRAGVQGGGRALHADHIERNVRSILEGGGSLPLVFPRYELGFSYEQNGVNEGSNAANDDSGDSAGYFPRLKVGHRMPHVLVEVLASSADKNDKGWDVMETLNHCRTASSHDLAGANSDSAVHISLTDISSQLRRVHSYSSPVFTLLAFGPVLAKSTTLTGEVVDHVMSKWNVPTMLVNVLPAESNIGEYSRLSGTHDGSELEGFNLLHTVDTQQALLRLLNDEHELASNTKERSKRIQHYGKAGENADDLVDALIMVRPDGHIASISYIDAEKENVETMTIRIREVMERGFRNALGDRVFED